MSLPRYRKYRGVLLWSRILHRRTGHKYFLAAFRVFLFSTNNYSSEESIMVEAMIERTESLIWRSKTARYFMVFIRLAF